MTKRPINKVYIWKCLDCECEFMVVSALPIPICCPFCSGKELAEEDEFEVKEKENLTKDT